ncbi:MAG TPA: dienelactone hydrolase family protein [Fimbriimonadaceae bacterium]|nr:dienelactone hydrolase family protein [Fimbriimonadaceae bacterium]
MRGERIEFDGNGTPYVGYLSRSDTGSGPGVIVLQEWWGLVDHIQDVADRFAAEGFTALAPDLYFGEATTEPTRAGELMMALNIGATEKLLAGAVDRLLADDSVTSEKVGVVGFCMGGQLSLFAAATNPKIGACVDFYGIHPKVEPDFAALRSPVLGLFAEHDAYASPEAVALLSAELDRHGKAHEFVTYPGTHHAFFNDTRPEVFDADAATDAWKRVVGFFRAHLN